QEAAELAQIAAESAKEIAEIAAGNASDSASAASSSALSAAQSASSASDSADAAALSASDASDRANAATLAATDAENQFKAFRGIYYGAAPSDPSVDPNGDPPNDGDWYFNTTLKEVRLYEGGEWHSVPMASYSKGEVDVFLAGKISKSGDTMTGKLGLTAVDAKVTALGDVGGETTIDVSSASTFMMIVTDDTTF